MGILAFDDDYRFHEDAESYIEFSATDGEWEIPCRVDREAVRQKWAGAPLGPNWMKLYEPMRTEIRAELQRMHDAGEHEPDGSLHLRPRQS